MEGDRLLVRAQVRGGVTADRVFVLVANRAEASGEAPLDDLPGQGGRFDVVARFVSAALLTSHGIREGASVIVWFKRGEPDPVAVRIRGGDAVGLRPDERSTAARLNKALAATAMPVWQKVGDGVEIRATSLGDLVERLPEPAWLLSEGGGFREEAFVEGASFVIGDQDGFEEEQRSILEERCAGLVSVGPVALQADQVVGIAHNVMDRAKGSRRAHRP